MVINRKPTLFEGVRMRLDEAYDASIASLNLYGGVYEHWAVMYSGGKDSSATAVVVADALDKGLIKKPPKSVTFIYSDTRLEFPPLQASAAGVLDALRDRGYDARVVMPSLDKRMMVNVLGRGVPPPSNLTRWCTEALKIKPAQLELELLGQTFNSRFLILTGVRVGESAARDQRIALSCSRDGGECGQGWFQRMEGGAVGDVLAPLLHWRVCHVWDYLTFFAPDLGFPTLPIADAYGGDEAQEINARTGCIGCNLVDEDKALNTLLKNDKWQYLAPLAELRPLWRELRELHNRLLHEGRTKKDGTPAARDGHPGAITLDARRYGLERVLDMQRRVNRAARSLNRPTVSLINRQEHDRIVELLDAGAYPQGWRGDEPNAETLVELRRDKADAGRGLLTVLGEAMNH